MGFKAESNIYCSPFRRCLQTAGILARSLGLNTIMVSDEPLSKSYPILILLSLCVFSHPNPIRYSRPPNLTFIHTGASWARRAYGSCTKGMQRHNEGAVYHCLNNTNIFPFFILTPAVTDYNKHRIAIK